jgi:hypothetical protein
MHHYFLMILSPQARFNPILIARIGPITSFPKHPFIIGHLDNRALFILHLSQPGQNLDGSTPAYERGGN